jgi:hypothetical protein
MLLIFFVTFINTGFVVVLASASFTEWDANDDFASIFNKRGFTDFSCDWYSLTGVMLISTMIKNSYFPVVEFMGFSMLGKFKRFLDRGCSGNVFNSKKKSVPAYIDTYSGPKYAIHFRYSALLTFISLALVYGAAMPLVFPISVLGYLVYWFNERLLIAYYYKQPPAYSVESTQSVLTILGWVPLLSTPFVWWQFGNRQIFENTLFELHSSRDPNLSGHTISSSI